MFFPFNRNIVLNVLSGFLGVFGIIGILCTLMLNHLWSIAAPRFPDPQHGIVYAQHVKLAASYYYTAFQANSLLLLGWLSFGAIITAGAVSPRRNAVISKSVLTISAVSDPDDSFEATKFGIVAAIVLSVWLIFEAGPLIVRALIGAGFVFHL